MNYHPVLVVEDNKTTRMLLCSFLEKLGVAYEEAEDGVEAISKLQHGRYSLVLLDIILPNKDGFEVLHWMRSTDTIIPVVAISDIAGQGDKSISYVKMAQLLGAEDGFGKPIRSTDLREILEYRRSMK
ncbi:response regulator [Rhodospirillaceae bacterium KN72]|uniref:Response regulator n=1 Tax=Pacificispira spongiicola TaxID=2729598 RepID=A0A7Y0HG34_9PROT|nr:response regulator [Pacificispira spongiicola]NMM46505.1 response regulator [Pacificispira spongiicola]